ncbi:MAG: hypothetical protein RLZZ528_507 [Pseudomonadota bacterium]|jgi:uncharacterized protein (TIGR02246 family)
MVDLAAARATADAYTAAWNSGRSAAVASFYAETGEIVINRGTPWTGRAGIAAMAEGFYADVPDLSLTCNDIRVAGDHVLYVWSFTGHHAGTKAPLKIDGWEEWEIDADGKVAASRGWYDGADYTRQVGA